MAYKFQIGDAKLSGSILTTANGSDVSSSDDLLAAGDVFAQGNITGSGMSLSDASGIAGTGLEDSSGALQVAASQSTITSILNDSLTLGRSDQSDMLDFSTDNRIKFKVGNVERLIITDTKRVQIGPTINPGGSDIPALVIGASSSDGGGQGTGFFAKADTNKFRLDSEGSKGQPGVIVASGDGAEDAGIKAHSLYLSTTGTSIYTSGSINASGDITGSGLSLSDASGIAGGSLEDDSGVLKVSDGGIDTAQLAAEAVTIAKVDTDVAGAGLVGGAGTALRVDISTAVTDASAMAADTFILSALNAGSNQTRRRYLNRMPPAFLSSAIGQSQALEASGSAVTGFVMDLKDTIPGARTFTSDVTIGGNLTVNGTNTILNTSELFVEDTNITIGSGSEPQDNMGITFGTSGSVQTLQITGSGQYLGSTLPLSASAFYGDGSFLTNVSADDSVQTFTASGSIDISNGLQVFADASGGAFNLTLPAAANLEGKMLKVKQLGSANPVTLTPPAGTIDGAGSIVLESPYSAVTIISSGSNYYVI